MNFWLPDLFSSKLKVGLNLVVACCFISYSYFFFVFAELHKGSRWFLLRVLQLILQVSYIQYFWFARDVTAAMLVVKNKSISLRRELNSIFMYILREKNPIEFTANMSALSTKNCSCHIHLRWFGKCIFSKSPWWVIILQCEISWIWSPSFLSMSRSEKEWCWWHWGTVFIVRVTTNPTNYPAVSSHFCRINAEALLQESIVAVCYMYYSSRNEAIQMESLQR